MNSKSGKDNINTLKLNIENSEESKFEEHDNDDDTSMNAHIRRLEIIQRKTSKSLLRTKYKQDRVQVILFFVGILGFPIISWGISWIIGRTCVKPKSHRGKKLRQLNGILTLIFIFVPAIFSYFYYQALVRLSFDTNNIFISTKEKSSDESQTSTITKIPSSVKISNTQILSCSSEIDIEIVLWKKDQSEEKGLVLFIGKLLAETWLKSNSLDEAYKNGFTVAAVSPPGYGRSGRIMNSRKGSQSQSEVISSSSFLFWLVNNCLKFDTRKMVIVAHSNSITQKFVIPLIMSYPIAGIVFFNTNMGIKWFNAKNPIINDHLYYQPINFNDTMVRYIGDRDSPVVSSNSVENPFGGLNIGNLSGESGNKVHISNKINVSTTSTSTRNFEDIKPSEPNTDDFVDEDLEQGEYDEPQPEDSSENSNSDSSGSLGIVDGILESMKPKEENDDSFNSKENSKYETATTTKKPGSATTTKKPGSATTTKKPGSATTTKKPGSATTTKKPGSATTTKKPGSATTTKKPGSVTTTRRPIAAVTTTTTKRVTIITTKPTVNTIKTTKSATIKNLQSKQQYLHAQSLMNKRFLASRTSSSDRNYNKGVSNINSVMRNCIAPNVTYKYDQRWYITEQNKMGPFGWFDGKYTIPGWKTMQMAYESFDFDALNSKKLNNGTYLLTLEYFQPLIETLNEILPLIAQRIAFSSLLNLNNTGGGVNSKNDIDKELYPSLDGTSSSKHIQDAPTTWSNHRQDAYLKYRANFELVPAQEIYCVS